MGHIAKLCKGMANHEGPLSWPDQMNNDPQELGDGRRYIRLPSDLFQPVRFSVVRLLDVGETLESRCDSLRGVFIPQIVPPP